MLFFVFFDEAETVSGRYIQGFTDIFGYVILKISSFQGGGLVRIYPDKSALPGNSTTCGLVGLGGHRTGP